MFRYLKKKAGLGSKNEAPPTDRFYSPLRIGLHSTIDVNTVDLIVIQEHLHPAFVFPQGRLNVLAIGEMDLQGMKMYRVYTEDEKRDEFILQIIEGQDYYTGESKVDEVLLFQQVVTHQPQSEASLDRILSNIGFKDIELDGITYGRIWGDEFTEQMELAETTETLVEPNGVNEYVNRYMLYGRTIRQDLDDTSEFLLVGLEEDEGGAEIPMQIGYILNNTDIEIQ